MRIEVLAHNNCLHSAFEKLPVSLSLALLKRLRDAVDERLLFFWPTSTKPVGTKTLRK